MKSFEQPFQSEETNAEQNSVEAMKNLRETFGASLLGMEEAEQLRGAPFTPTEQAEIVKAVKEKLRVIGLTKDVLEKLKKDGFEVVVRSPSLIIDGKLNPTTIMALRKKFPEKFNKHDWYSEEPFANIDTPRSVAIVKEKILEASGAKTREEQEALLEYFAKELTINPNLFDRRTPVEIVYDIIAQYKARGEQMLEDDYDLSKGLDSKASQVAVGGSKNGIDIRDYMKTNEKTGKREPMDIKVGYVPVM